VSRKESGGIETEAYDTREKTTTGKTMKAKTEKSANRWGGLKETKAFTDQNVNPKLVVKRTEGKPKKEAVNGDEHSWIGERDLGGKKGH